MNKKELVNKFATKSEITKKSAEKYLEDLLEVIMDGVAEDGIIKLVGFGSFIKQEVKGRTGTIQFGDKKGQEWKTEDSVKPVFKPGVLFENKVKGVVSETKDEE